MLRGSHAVRGAAALAAAALLSGCGGSANHAQPAVPDVARPADAASVLAAALTLLRTDGTGGFDAVTTSVADGFLSTRQVGGTFDLSEDRWAGTVDLAVSAVGNPHVGGYAAKLVGKGDTLFVNMGKGAKALDGSAAKTAAARLRAGNWYRTPAGDLPAGADDLALVETLAAVTAKEIRPSGGGGQVVTGTIPAAEAVRLLGLSAEAERLHAGAARLAGTSLVTVTLDGAGRLARVRLSGDDVTFVAKPPAKLREMVKAASYAQTFHSLGEKVAIKAPTSATDAAGELEKAARDVL